MLNAVKTTVTQNKKLFVRFFVSLLVSVLVLSCGFAVYTYADAETEVLESAQQNGQDVTIAPDDTSALYDLIGVDASEPIEVIILITLLSVAPSLLIMLTSFTRIVIVFSFLRTAMQTQATPPNMVITGLSLFLTIFIMWPVFSEINTAAYQPYANGEITTEEAIHKAGEPLKTFMLKQTSNSSMEFFLDLSSVTIYTPETADSESPVEVTDFGEITLENYQEQLGFEVVIPAFIVSELTRAFQMGFMLFIPFLVIDLVVSSTLMSMGMMMLPPAMISLPFKILLFVLVDGWQLLVGTLVTSFNY